VSEFSAPTPWRAGHRLEEPELYGSSDGVASTVGAEFAVDHALVGFHGVDRQVQLRGDLGVGQGAREVAQYDLFALGQGLDERGRDRERLAVLPGHPA
jgi:hypothetical protein